MSSSISIRNTLDWAMTKPSLTKVLGSPISGLGGTHIPVRIANKVFQQILQEPFGWKWNRYAGSPFVLNALQQDYCTSIKDLGWIENAVREELNNPQYAPPAPPTNRTRGVEVVRELLPCSVSGIIQQLCWIPNSLAQLGTWQPDIQYVDPSLGTSMPTQPLTQIRDSNGNIQVLSTYGTTGDTAPTWPVASATPGTVTQDGTAAWTVADPDGIALRVSPLPPEAGTVFQVRYFYQRKPPLIQNVAALWAPIPDELSDLYETGFVAYAWEQAEEDAKFEKSFMLFQMRIKKALSAGTRELESFCMFPGRSLMGQSGTGNRGDEEYPPGLFL